VASWSKSSVFRGVEGIKLHVKGGKKKYVPGMGRAGTGRGGTKKPWFKKEEPESGTSEEEITREKCQLVGLSI